MAWELAPSLAVLRAEINARWPGRDRKSDGTIGDADHAASVSDHNPNSRGRVDALDIDNDGIDVWAVFARITKHPSARYFIYRNRLYHRQRGWRAEVYSGASPHTEHFHLSIDQTAKSENDRRPWGLLEDKMPLTDADVEKVWQYPVRWRGSSEDRPTVPAASGLYYTQNDSYAAQQEAKAIRVELAAALAILRTATVPVIDYDLLAQALLKAVLTK